VIRARRSLKSLSSRNTQWTVHRVFQCFKTGNF
jgi:hypothetical protein